MSLETPKVNDIADNIIAQLQSKFNQGIPLLPKSFMRILAKVLAGVFVILYKYAGNSFLQTFVRTASSTETEVLGKTVNPLLEWGRLIGAGDPTPASVAELNVDVTVNIETGSIDAGTALEGLNNGVIYLVTESVLLDSPTVNLVLRSTVSGAIGNLVAADVLTFVNPEPNVEQEVVVSIANVTAEDAEDFETYRARVIELFRGIPTGGSYFDWRTWANTTSGIINSYIYTGDDPGTVEIYVESGTEPDGIPTPAQLAAVIEAVNFDEDGLATRRPVNALPFSFAITRVEFSVEVSGIAGVPSLPDVQNAIISTVTAYFVEREPFIAGLDFPPKKDLISKNQILCLVEDIITAAGGTFTDVVLKNSGGTPISSYTLDSVTKGEKAKVTAITFL